MRSFNPDMEEGFTRKYDNDGVLHEYMGRANECDYACESFHRTSKDKGQTWSEWETVFKDNSGGRHGAVPDSPDGDELIGGPASPTLYDPISGCWFGVRGSAYYLKGHNVGYFAMALDGEDNVRFHGYYAIRYPDGREVSKMIELEEGGADYDPAKYRDPNFLDKNRCQAGDLHILPDGDLCFYIYPSVTLGCKIAGIDVNSYFPSSPNLHCGLIVVRAHWDAEKSDYDFTYSNVIMLSDVQSSRCIMEPHMVTLKSGRMLLVVRGSNYTHEPWNTRISPRAPGFKWYTFSDDGGRTFAPLMPWHFDTREVVYSSASIHSFYRSKQNGKLYWIGNVIEPQLIFANDPRFPLQICEVNEEYGYLIKDTLTVIETVREGQWKVELSNFNLLEDPDTGKLEMRMTKININDAEQGMGKPGDWYSEAWEYFFEFPVDE
ncbi:MAG: hypothetical protein E7638_08725 [Ruminococcaceae bacterium]|nr:hypothetical protein [Oscillospiraceae bacterium]